MLHRDLVVVIVTYNSARHVGDSLRALTDFDVQVVDNGSSDATRDLVSLFDNAHLYRSPRNLGYGAAVNLAARLHPGKDLMLLNPDVISTRQAIESLAAHRTDGVGVVAPRLLNADGSLQYSARNPQTLGVMFLTRTPFGRTKWGASLAEWQHLPSFAARESEVPWVTGAAMLFHRPAFDFVGGFDDAFFMYQEDQDICLRLRRAGFSILYVPSVVMSHEHARESKSSGRAARRHAASTVKFFGRHPEMLLRRYAVKRLYD